MWNEKVGVFQGTAPEFPCNRFSDDRTNIYMSEIYLFVSKKFHFCWVFAYLCAVPSSPAIEMKARYSYRSFALRWRAGDVFRMKLVLNKFNFIAKNCRINKRIYDSREDVLWSAKQH